MAEKTGVQIRRYDVIYKITDDLKLALEGMLKPEEREVEQGRVLVQQVFKISRVGTVAGCRVLSRRGRAQQPRPGHPRQHDHRRLRASIRFAARRTMPRKFAKATNAASSWPASTTSRKATCSRFTRSKKSNGSLIAKSSVSSRVTNVE